MTFLKLARTAGEVRGGLVSWLHRCAVNTSIDLARRAEARRRHEAHAAATPPPPAADPHWAEVSRALDDALAELPDADRGLILRHFYEGEPQTRLAADRGVRVIVTEFSGGGPPTGWTAYGPDGQTPTIRVHHSLGRPQGETEFKVYISRVVLFEQGQERSYQVTDRGDAFAERR